MSNLHFGERRYWQDFAKYSPLLLFGFALLLRVVLVFRLETYSSPYHLSEHVQIAEHILNGKGYSFNWYGLGDAGEGSFMPPPYVAIVLVAKVLFPATSWLVIQIFQALLSAWTAMVTYFIGKEIFSELTGMIASFLVAVYPPFLGYVLDIQTVVWETFWVVLSVLACIYWKKHGTWRRAILVGFVLGIAVLSRSNLILLLPLLFIWMVLNRGRQGASHFAVVICVFMLVLGPWVVRNYLVHKGLVLVSTNGGFTFFMGNNVNATGVCYAELGDVWKQYPGLARELAPLGEAERDRRLYQAGMDFIQTHPQEAFSLALKRVAYFWWFKPGYVEGGTISGYPWYFGLIYMGSYAVILGFSILGLVLSFEKYKFLYIFYAFFLVQTIVVMTFEAGTRFRTILEPLLIVLAGYGIVWLLSRWGTFSQKLGRVSSWLLTSIKLHDKRDVA